MIKTKCKHQDKLQLIFYPFLLAGSLFIILYTIFHWVFILELELISIKENVITTILPFTLPWAVLFIWIRPRIKLLTFRNDRLPMLYYFAATLSITIPTLIAQPYLINATGKLTELNNINEIDKYPPTKFYTIENYYIDKDRIGVTTEFHEKGKRNERLVMIIYVVLPVFNTDTNYATHKAWVAIKFSKEIDNRQSDADKEFLFQKFAMESQESINDFNTHSFKYFSRIGNSDDRDAFLDATSKSAFRASGNSTILLPQYEPFEERNGNKLAWIFGSYFIGVIVFYFMLLFVPISKSNIKKFRKGTLSKNNYHDSPFYPNKNYLITPLLIYLNILVFGLLVLNGSGFNNIKAVDLIQWGANTDEHTLAGEWWRLITCIFLHGGAMHLAMNIAGLAIAGIFLEPFTGRLRFLCIYFFTGIIAGVTSLWWNTHVVSVGASGAIFGLYGYLLVSLATGMNSSLPRSFITGIIIYLGINLLIGLTGGIDNAAHIGGVLSGSGLAFILFLFSGKENCNNTIRANKRTGK